MTNTPPDGPTARVVDGKYHLLRLLPGRGEVMRAIAEHPGIGRTVELRMLAPRAEPSGLAWRLLEHEARTLGSSPHAHLQSVIDGGTENGRPYVVLEALDAPSVADLMIANPGGIDVERAARLVLQVLDALRALHRHHTVLRSLGPENVLVLEKRDGEFVKLTGLDRAEVLDADPTGLPVPFSPYLAPEIRRGSPGRDVRVDVHSVGALFRHLLTGKPNASAVVEDELAERAIGRMTADDPDDRFPNVDVCMQAVAVCAAPDEQPRTRLPSDPLVRDLHYLTLRRRTLHRARTDDRTAATVELHFVLFVLEALYRRVGEEVWAKLVDSVPDVEAWLPSAIDSTRFRVDGVPVTVFERALEEADHLGGADDLGLLSELADAVVAKGARRLFPDLPSTLSVDAVVDGLPFLWSRVRREGSASVVTRGERVARVAIQGQTCASLEISGLFAATVRALLRLVAPGADVSVLACAALGDDADVFVLRW